MRRPACAWCSLALWFGLFLTAPSTASLAADRSSFGTAHLQRDLRGLRTRVERAPRASVYDLKRVERRLHDQRLDTPRDPRLQNLAIETRRLRWQADRADRRPVGTTVGSAVPTAAVPATTIRRHSGGSHIRLPERGAGLDVGRRVVALQAALRTVEAQIEGDDGEAAAELLASARAGLARLESALGTMAGEDPNLLALDDQIRALEARR